MVGVMDRLRVGTAGIPHAAGKRSTLEGVRVVAELGLDAMEIEFVRGVRMRPEVADQVRELTREVDVVLTVHAPYYVNLFSRDEAKVEASVKRVLDAARVGYRAGAWSVVFHPGYYGKLGPEEAVEGLKEWLKKIVATLIDEGVDIWVRPEVMGGLSEVGALEEVLEAVAGIENAAPCIDFAHLYARSLGKINGYSGFRAVLAMVEERLGSDYLEAMHIHVSGMEYGPRGERRHLNFDESEFAWQDLVRVLKEFNVKGVIISESPNLEGDALKIKVALEQDP